MRYKRPARRNIGIEIDPGVVMRWETVQGPDVEPLRLDIEFVRRDAVEYLEAFPFSGKELIYCDPPYLRETRRGGRLYNFEYTVDQRKELLKIIKSLPCMVRFPGIIPGCTRRPWEIGIPFPFRP